MQNKLTSLDSFQLLATLLLILLIAPAHHVVAQVDYEYDTLHRLVSVTYDNGAEVVYSYDKVGNRLSRNAVGSDETLFEDAENGDLAGWDIYDATPTGAEIDNVYDDANKYK